MPFWQPFVTVMAGKQFVENTSSCSIRIITPLFYRINIKPPDSALGQPLRMVAHASKRGYPLNLRRRRGKGHIMVMEFVEVGGCGSAVE